MEDIFHLIREGNALAVRIWLESTENDFNMIDDHGFSLLHWASWDGRLSIVEMLLNRGAKVNAINKSEDTSLHCAAQHNHLDVVCCLLRNKANVNSANIHGNTALHYACHFGYADLALELIKLGAVVNLCNRFNQTPLDLCRLPLRELLISFAKSFNLDMTPVEFKEDASWSRNKNIDAGFFSNQTEGINIDEIPIEFTLDSNHGGKTWKGYWQKTEVVIKAIKVKEVNQRVANAFTQECKRLRIFNMANILPVIGCCVSMPDLIIVNQFACFGSLFSVLHERSDILVDFNLAINFAVGIAKGMEFLHNLESPIPNYNLNSKHVMVDEDLTAKINMADCTFSFSNRDKLYSPAWMSPEALRKKSEDINRKASDMWSFGVVLWEMHTREIPFGQFSPMQSGLLITIESKRLKLPSEMSVHLQKLIKICMNEDPQKRPKFEMILPILEKLKNNPAK